MSAQAQTTLLQLRAALPFLFVSGLISDFYRIAVRSYYGVDRFSPTELELPWILTPGIVFGLALAIVGVAAEFGRRSTLIISVTVIWYLAVLVAIDDSMSVHGELGMTITAATAAACIYLAVALLNGHRKLKDFALGAFIVFVVGGVVFYIPSLFGAAIIYTSWQVIVGLTILYLVRVRHGGIRIVGAPST